MPLLPLRQISDAKLKPFLDGLTNTYTAMDRAYRSAANHYGFKCSGCEDSCCYSRFFHYTYIEYIYLFKGHYSLDAAANAEVRKRALKMIAEYNAADSKPVVMRHMCPLNFNGRCILYDHRPMICRLHGIPHEFQTPRKRVIYAPGCAAFNRDHGDKDYLKFDRTPFYIEMARLERGFKQALDVRGKLKMTIAEMVVTF